MTLAKPERCGLRLYFVEKNLFLPREVLTKPA